MSNNLGNASGTLRNTDSVATPKQGEFQPGVPRTVPTAHTHKPGVKLNPEDNKPEYHMQAFPPGSAPTNASHRPQGDESSQALNPAVERGHGKESTKTSASQTMMGSSSAEVDQGFGKPMQGETSTEVRHEGQHGRKNPGSGLEGVGATQP